MVHQRQLPARADQAAVKDDIGRVMLVEPVRRADVVPRRGKSVYSFANHLVGQLPGCYQRRDEHGISFDLSGAQAASRTYCRTDRERQERFGGCAREIARERDARKRDSDQRRREPVYADLSILSARPSGEEMQGVPHRLFGHVDAAEPHNAARWADEARAAIAAAHEAGDVPILVGGTGLYFRTLLSGIAPVPEIDPEIRETVRAMPVAEAHAALARLDPETAARLNPADTTRVARALEVVRATGRTLADWQQARAGGIADDIALAPLVLLPPRDWLRDRCDARLIRMFGQGAVDEVEALLARRLDPDLPAMRAIGVPQIASHLRGEIGRARGARSGRKRPRANMQSANIRGFAISPCRLATSHRVTKQRFYQSISNNIT